MAPPTRTPRSAWIAAARDVFAAGGPDAVRIEPLAKALGVTRGGFYWHFADRDELLRALLDSWERAATDDVLERVEQRGGDARAKARRAGLLTFSDELMGVDLAVRGWARRDGEVAQRLRRVDNRRIAYLRQLLSEFCADEAEVEARSLLAFALLIGNHFITAEHGTRSRSEVLELAGRWLLA